MGAAGAPPGLCPVLAGPTAVGKTALVTRLARRHPVEVVSLDSRQVYRGLRIGTAQPTAAERASCPHHLVDFLSPEESYSAARFRADFVAVHREIRARGRVPLLVGGAGLYLQALREGLFELDAAATAALPSVRAELDALTDAEVRRRLARLDPDSARRIHPHDRYRSRRALEIRLVSGRSMTELAATQRPRPALGLAFPTVVLERPVAELNRRIADRTAAMLGGGWLEETAGLLARHGADARGLDTLGYREVVAHLEGRLSRAELAPAIVTRTRQYAKRQRTWFRGMPCEAAGTPESAAVGEALERLLAAAAGPAPPL